MWGGGGVCCHRWVLQPRRRRPGGLRGGSYDLRIAKIAKVYKDGAAYEQDPCCDIKEERVTFLGMHNCPKIPSVITRCRRQIIFDLSLEVCGNSGLSLLEINQLMSKLGRHVHCP